MKQLLKGRRIFIIEDNAANLQVFTASITGSGASVEQNVMGYDIVGHIAKCLPIDLIILDIKLRKGADGYDTYERIRMAPSLKQIPIVVITALDPDTEIPRAKAKGADGFISKPVSMRELPVYLAKVLGGEKIWISHDLHW